MQPHRFEKPIAKNSFIFLFLAISLHQSGYILGVNASLADVFCMIIFGGYVLKNQLAFPVRPVIFFCCLTISVLLTAIFYVPLIFGLQPNPLDIMKDYTKLLANFIYFLTGYQLAFDGRIEKTIRWYSISGIGIGLIGAAITFLQLPLLRDQLFFAGVRYKGLMIDPNYFSVLQITTIVYFLKSAEIKSSIRFFALAVISLSVMASGSKTGIIALMVYLLIIGFENLFFLKNRAAKMIRHLLVLALFLFGSIYFIRFGQVFMQNLSGYLPVSERVFYIFTDFEEAVTASGSERSGIWRAALGIILSSPLFGIGIGTYSSLSEKLFWIDNVAHNTYLQMFAEWGIPFTVVFIIFVFSYLIKASWNRDFMPEIIPILRDMILVLFIGSMAISLNNARILWLLLGAILSLFHRKAHHHFLYKRGNL